MAYFFFGRACPTNVRPTNDFAKKPFPPEPSNFRHNHPRLLFFEIKKMSSVATLDANAALWGTDQPVVANLAFWTDRHAEALERIRTLESALEKERASRSLLVVRRSRFPTRFSDDHAVVSLADLPLGVRLACERSPSLRRERTHPTAVEEKDTVDLVGVSRSLCPDEPGEPRGERIRQFHYRDDPRAMWEKYVAWIADVDHFAETPCYHDIGRDYPAVQSNQELGRYVRESLERMTSLVDRLVAQYGHDAEWRRTLGAEVCAVHRPNGDYVASVPPEAIVDECDRLSFALSSCFRMYQDELTRGFMSAWTGREACGKFCLEIPAHKKFLAVFHV